MSGAEAALLAAVRRAHIASVQRANTSRAVFLSTINGSGNYVNGLIAALATLGGNHAPIAQTMWVLSQPDLPATIRELLAEGQRVPGWGNSFVRGEPDDLWTEVDALLAKEFTPLHLQLVAGTTTLHTAGKLLFPNPSAYTAAAALLVGLRPDVAPWLFVSARLDGWTQLHLQHTGGIA